MFKKVIAFILYLVALVQMAIGGSMLPAVLIRHFGDGWDMGLASSATLCEFMWLSGIILWIVSNILWHHKGRKHA